MGRTDDVRIATMGSGIIGHMWFNLRISNRAWRYSVMDILTIEVRRFYGRR